MTEFREFDFSHEAVGYVQNRLETAGTLGKQVRRCLNLEEGKVVALLPEDVEPEYAVRFQYGFWMCGDEPWKWVVSSISEYLARDPSRIVVFELSRPPTGVPGVTSDTFRIGKFQNELVLFLVGPIANSAIINLAMRAATRFPDRLGYMTSSPTAHGDPSVTELITQDYLQELAARTEKIVLGAYDGEGHLIWHKRDPPSA
jgi:hypothetical protein